MSYRILYRKQKYQVQGRPSGEYYWVDIDKPFESPDKAYEFKKIIEKTEVHVE